MSKNHIFVTYYTSIPRHWSSQSEKYTGVDSLVTALLSDWHINRRVFRHDTWRGGSRPVSVYYFELQRDGEMMTMPVIHNPYLDYIVRELSLEVITQTFWEAETV